MANRTADTLARLRTAEKQSPDLNSVLRELRTIYGDDLAGHFADMPVERQRELAAQWRKCFALWDKYEAGGNADPSGRAFRETFGDFRQSNPFLNNQLPSD